MNSRLNTRLYALLLACAMLMVLASCGGSSSTTTPIDQPDVIIDPNDQPPLIPDDGGVPQYPGQGRPPGSPDPTPPAQPPLPGSWNFGDLIYSVPVDAQGRGRVQVDTFAAGQKAAFVAINTNPLFLDAHNNASGEFPALPASSYSFEANLVNKGVASAKGGATFGSLDELSPQSDYALTSESGTLSPLAIYEREARAQGEIPYAVEPSKTTSLLQKGEILTFTNVLQRTPKLPPIQPGTEDPDRDLSEFGWPLLYQSQDGRLVAVGQHCLIFLSTEINNGHPDNIRFTQARLNRMAAEFDFNIFPTLTTQFGPVKNYQETDVYRDLDRTTILTGDDFDQQGNLTRTLPGSPDFRIADEGKILIFIYNGEQGGFFTYGEALDEEGTLTTVGSTLYLGGDNFPTNSDDFNAAMSVMAHEFQHKLYNDNGLPRRATEHDWFNEGLSQLALYVCGYTPSSGKLISWAVEDQLSGYLQNINRAAVPMDGNAQMSTDWKYGSGLLFFLYMFEHYDPGVAKRIYDAATKDGVSDRILLIERGAQMTIDGQVHQDTFQQVYTKFAIANFIDGINADEQAHFDDRFHYDTIDLRGTVNLSTGTVQLPGVRVGVFPDTGTYPAIANDRLIFPWAIDYLVFGNGDGRDLDIEFSGDETIRLYMLPVEQQKDPVTGQLISNKVKISEDVSIGY